MKDKLTYEQAMAQLQQILEELQSEQSSIDELTNKSKQAKELLEYCRAKLRGVEEELGDL